MADRTMSAKVLNVSKTTAQWAANDVKDVIISKGLVCVEFKTDSTTWVKIGDGTHKFAELPYITDGAIGSLGNIFTVKGVVATVSDLPATGNKVGDVYFVGDSSTAGTDKYSEYVWTSGNTWEFIGQVAAEIPVYSGGTGITIDANNAINLDIASANALGGIKVGANLTIANDGTLSASADTVFDSNSPYDASTNPAATVGTVTGAIGALDGSVTGSAGAGKTLTSFSQTDGVVSAAFDSISITKSQVSDFPTLGTAAAADVAASIASGSDDLATAGQVYSATSGKQDAITFDGTYNASTNKAATVSTVTGAIGALDVPASGTGSISGFGAGKTLASLTETDGKVAATFQSISITKSQVSDFPSLGTAAAADVAASIASGSGDLATSGQVYSGLAGKQDTLTFDGTYNASTNKAATVSTVTTAVANKVDKDDTLILNCTL